MNNLNLPANCAVMTEDEMSYVNGGFELTAPMIATGVAVIAVGAMALNMLSWFTGSSDTNFIEDSISFGQSFINGSLEMGQSFLDGLMGK